MRRLAAALPFALAGCVYYNGLWSAHQFARDARRQEAAGQVAQARTSWALAALRAESVAVRHPTSRWLADALVLQGEGLAGSFGCADARAPLTRALTITTDVALRERALLAQGMCALGDSDAALAGRLADSVLASKDADRRSHAAALAGRAALLRGAPDTAVMFLARSTLRTAAVARVLVLLRLGRVEDADALCDTLVQRRPLEGEWDSVFTTFAEVAGAERASRVVGRITPRARWSGGARARAYLDDGDRLLRIDQFDSADARYVQAGRAAPDSAEADIAQFRRIRARLIGRATPESLSAISMALAPLAEHGAAVTEARQLVAVIRRLQTTDSTALSAFRNGELARDSLGAHRLAAEILLRFARGRPTSIFAPKAILAALPITAPPNDSLVAVLDATYPTSPYTLAFRGKATTAYTAAEDSLAQLFGLHDVGLGSITPRVVVASRWAPPVPGPKGPRLEDIPPAAKPTPVRTRIPARQQSPSVDDRP